MAVSGIAIITKGVPFNRRNRFILTAALAGGYGATLVPTYFSHVFTYAGGNKGLQGFLDAIVLVMETGFAVTAFVACILNLALPPEFEEPVEEAAPLRQTEAARAAGPGPADGGEESDKGTRQASQSIEGSGSAAAAEEGYGRHEKAL